MEGQSIQQESASYDAETMDEEDRRAYEAWDGQRHKSAEFSVGDVHGNRGTSMLFMKGEYAYDGEYGSDVPGSLKQQKSATVEVADAYGDMRSTSAILQSEDYSLDAVRASHNAQVSPLDDDGDDDGEPPAALQKEKSVA